jgi:hypothetical protein
MDGFHYFVECCIPLCVCGVALNYILNLSVLVAYCVEECQKLIQCISHVLVSARVDTGVRVVSVSVLASFDNFVYCILVPCHCTCRCRARGGIALEENRSLENTLYHI